MIHFIKVIVWMCYTLPREYDIYSAEVAQHKAWPWQRDIVKAWNKQIQKEFANLLSAAKERSEAAEPSLDGELWSIDPVDVPPTDKLN